MKKLILGLLFMISPFLILAHNPLSAKYSFIAVENTSLLTIHLSQGGINQALLKKYTQNELETMQPKQLKELIVAYIKNHLELSIDSDKIELVEGGIKLGDHQTDLKFILPAISKKAEHISINIPAFKENGEHQSIFLYNIFGKKNKVILSKKNNFRADIDLTDKHSSVNWLWIIAIVTLLLIALKVISKFYSNKNV